MKKFFKIFGIVFSVVGIVLGVGIYFYPKYSYTLLKLLKVPNNEAILYAKEIGRFIELPTGEEPVLATVLDIEKLKGQPFFAKAINGDKVLIYSQNKKAILYRPSNGKVLEMAPLLIDTNSQGNVAGVADVRESTPTQAPVGNIPSNAPNAEPQKTAIVAIYNGTTEAGAALVTESKLKVVDGIEVAQKDNASKTDYKKTLVVDITGGHDELIKKILGVVGGEQGSMPTTELKPTADILIIYGK